MNIAVTTILNGFGQKNGLGPLGVKRISRHPKCFIWIFHEKVIKGQT